MKLIICDNYDEVSHKASQEIIELIKYKPDCILGLATGSSPIGLYENLIKATSEKEISFSEVTTYNLDEYCGIEKSNPQSYDSFMNENLFNYVDIDKQKVHIPYASNDNMQEDCNTYNNALNSVSVDLQVLGIGANGHIGFNEPGTSFDQETFIIELTEQTRQDNARFFGSIDLVPTHAITMGIKNINNAKKIVLVASGESKSQAVYDLIHASACVDKPQTSLQSHEDVVVIVDKAAAKLL